MNRLSWWDVPESFAVEVRRRLRSRVVEAATQPGGFSPGVAALCLLEDGRSVFIKACGTGINPMTPKLHRHEAAVLDRLRDVPFVPALLDVVDNGDWIALLIEGVHGRLPTARDSSAVTRVLSLLTRVQSLPPGLLPPMGDPSFAQLQISPWADLAADGVALDPWSVEHLDELLTLEQQAGALEGTVVCHGDFRLDNVLFTADGHTSLADWAHAKAGPDFADLVEVCIDIHVEGGPAPAVTFAAHAPTALHTSDGVTAYLAAVTGRLTRQGTFAEPPGMTDFRAFQQRQAASAQSWLARRMAAGI